MARYPAAIQKPASPSNYSTRLCYPKFIVVHVMEGTLDGTASWFANPKAQVSSHFGIGRDGTVYQFVDTDYQAWAEQDFNAVAISIEHEGYSGFPLTPKQEEAAILLCKWIHAKSGVPLKRQSNPNALVGGIIGHGQLGMAGGNHPECPGAPILNDYNRMVRKMNPSPIRKLINKLINRREP